MREKLEQIAEKSKERIEQIKNRIVKENLNYVFLGMVDKYKNNNSIIRWYKF